MGISLFDEGECRDLSTDAGFKRLQRKHQTAIERDAAAIINAIQIYLRSLTLNVRTQVANIILRELEGVKATQLGTLQAAVYESTMSQIKKYADQQVVERLKIDFDFAISPENASLLPTLFPHLFNHASLRA